MHRLLLNSIALLAALPALAQADSNIIIGGIIDAGVRVDSGTASGTIRSVGSGQASASRLTISGIEDLGGGLQAGFVLESGMAIDTGTGVSNPPGAAAGALTWGRTSAVAVGSDSAGFLSFGRQYTPLFAVSAGPANDPFGANWFGGIVTAYSLTVRASNSIVYSYGYTARTMLLPAPRQGLGLALMYAPSEVGAPYPSGSGQQAGLNVSYGTASWWVGYGYHQVAGSNTAISATAPITDQPKVKQQTLGASYVVGNTRLYAGVNRGSSDGTGSAALNRNNWHVGAAVPFGGFHTLRVLYGKANDRTAANVSWNTWQVGYQYDLSKRTALYAAAGQVDNNANAQQLLGGSMATASKGAQARSLVSGLRHTF
jgi:predicted porin